MENNAQSCGQKDRFTDSVCGASAPPPWLPPTHADELLRFARECCFKLKRLGNDDGAGFTIFGQGEREQTGADVPDSGGAFWKTGDKHSVGFGGWFRDGAKGTSANAY